MIIALFSIIYSIYSIMTLVYSNISFNTLAQHLPMRQVHMVSDVHSFAACQCEDLPPCVEKHHCYDTPPQASVHTAIALAQQARGCSALLAVGSGTINDICKYAAHLLHVPYAVVATAPSMNGYVSPNASLVRGKHKESITASAPIAVFYDDTILTYAPLRLIQAGIGDTLCRATVQADAMLAHHLIKAEDYSTLFAAQHEQEQHVCKQLQRGVRFAAPALMHALLVSGEAMAAAGSSAPASQAEHMIAHVLEMIHPELHNYYHGEVIAVTTMTMAQLWHDAAQYVGQPISRKPFPFAALSAMFGAQQATLWQRSYEEKWRKVELHARFPDMTAYIPDVRGLENTLRMAGCPTEAKQLNIPHEIYQTAIKYAPFTRNRFTLLDVLPS
jgi:glycerol-1-phosphate dehydrogenase [NAD(P)+]